MNLSRLVIRGFALALVFAIMLPPLSRVLAADSETATEFGIYCAKCHGTEGQGDGPNASTLKTKPRDFADCNRMKSESDDMLFNVIKNGGPAGKFSADMPAWKEGFEDAEIHDLVKFVRGFCKQ